MVKLPILSGSELIKILRKNGFQLVGQKGSHVRLRKGIHKTVVPLHDELSKGTLLGIFLGILKQCGLSKDELVEFMNT